MLTTRAGGTVRVMHPGSSQGCCGWDAAPLPGWQHRVTPLRREPSGLREALPKHFGRVSEPQKRRERRRRPRWPRAGAVLACSREMSLRPRAKAAPGSFVRRTRKAETWPLPSLNCLAVALLPFLTLQLGPSSAATALSLSQAVPPGRAEQCLMPLTEMQGIAAAPKLWLLHTPFFWKETTKPQTVISLRGLSENYVVVPFRFLAWPDIFRNRNEGF